MPVDPLPSTSPRRALLVDDHPAVRMGIRAIVEADGSVEVAAEAASAGAAVVAFRAQPFDVVLLDLGLPDAHGGRAVGMLLDAGAAGRILVVTASHGLQPLQDCLELGASGYVLKTSSPEVVRQAVRAVADGSRFIDPELLRAAITGVVHGLTARELEVLEAVSHGLTNRQVATRLGLADHTVKTHMTSAMRKLGAHDRTHAVATLLRRGILT